MSQSVKLEAFVAWPPTSKCQKMMEILGEVVRRHPDQVRLVVFKRGSREMPERPSPSMSTLIHKGSVVPACLVDGKVFSLSQVPNLGELDARVRQVLDSRAS